MQTIWYIIAEKVPSDWEESYIANLLKGKGDATDRGNNRGLKLTDHCLKVIEGVLEQVLRDTVHVNKMQFGFVPGRGTIDAILVVCQLNACISGFPRGATPGDLGGFVKKPKQNVFNPLGYGAGKSDHISRPPGSKRS